MSVVIANVLANDTTASSVPTEVVIAVGIVALIAVPGYALGVVSARGSRDPDAGEQAFLARTALVSVVVHGLVLWWTIPLAEAVRSGGLRRHVADASAWLFVVCVALPVLLGNIEAWFGRRNPDAWTGRVASALGIAGADRVANAWSDMAEGRTDAAGFALITLRDGRVMTGYRGDRSFLSGDSRTHDLYLQRAVEVGPDGRFADVPASRGFWVNGDDIVSIEFFMSAVDHEAAFERRGRRRWPAGPRRGRREEGESVNTDPEHTDALSDPEPTVALPDPGKARSTYRARRQPGRALAKPDTVAPVGRGIQSKQPDAAVPAGSGVQDTAPVSDPEETTT